MLPPYGSCDCVTNKVYGLENITALVSDSSSILDTTKLTGPVVASLCKDIMNVALGQCKGMFDFVWVVCSTIAKH